MFTDDRDTTYRLHKMYIDEEARKDGTIWIQLLITAVGWVPAYGDITKIAMKLIGKATDGFKAQSVSIKKLDDLFKKNKLGNLRTFLDTSEDKIQKNLKKGLKNRKNH